MTLVFALAATLLVLVSAGVLWLVWRCDTALTPPSVHEPEAPPDARYGKAA